jgi:hypothetical protein
VKRPVPWLLQLLLVASIVCLTGCRQPVRPMKFNNMIARSNAKLAEPAKRFYKAVQPLSQGKDADVTGARSAYGEIESTLKELRLEFDTIKPPTGSQPAADLLEKYQSFLATEQEIFDNCFGPMMSAAQNSSLSPGDKWAIIQPLLSKASSKEGPVLGALKNLQKEYATKHNLDPQG